VNADVTKAWLSATLSHDRPLACFRFSPCGRFAAAAGHDEKVWKWTLETGEKSSTEGHASWIAALAFGPDGALYSADLHGRVVTPDGAFDAGHRPFLRVLLVSPDGKTLLTAGDDGMVKLWRNAKKVGELKGHASPVYSGAFTPDGKGAVTGDLLGKILHWDLESGALVRALDASILHTRDEDFIADVGGVRSLAFNAGGTLLAAGGMKDAKSNTFCPGTPAALVFDWASGTRKSELTLKGSSVDGPLNAVRWLAGDVLVGISETHGSNAGVWFWKPEGPHPFHETQGVSSYDLDVHPDGLRIGMASYLAKGRGGNGRHAKDRSEYVANGGAVRIYSLFPKPAPEKKKK
jgi:WD40 repeat protein